MANCKGLVANCKKCGYKFEFYEQMVHCPDCGQERKCGKYPISGYTLCAKHGGPRPEVGYYGNKGKFSMTKRQADTGTSPLNKVASKYLEIQGDPQAQTLRPLHSILNARLMKLLDKVNVGDSTSQIEKVIQLWI